MKLPMSRGLESFRVRLPVFWIEDHEPEGPNGAFAIPLRAIYPPARSSYKGRKEIASCIAYDGVSYAEHAPADALGWEHVSVCIRGPGGLSRTPSWDEMDAVCRVFWGENEPVFQFHPPRAERVNNHPNVLHLWRPVAGTVDRPPASLVGIPGVSPERAERVARAFAARYRSGS